MSNELYFIPLIEKALQQSEPKEALIEAFATIQSIGKQPEYKEGLNHFYQFMESAAQEYTNLMDDQNTEEELFLKYVHAHPKWKQDYESFCQEIDDSESSLSFPTIQIMREDKIIDTLLIEQRPASTTIENLIPGHYVIQFDTGHVLWEGHLSEAILIWSSAFPKQPLQLAADTGESKVNATYEVSLLNNEITLKCYPGLETGRMKITIHQPNEL